MSMHLENTKYTVNMNKIAHVISKYKYTYNYVNKCSTTHAQPRVLWVLSCLFTQ